MEKKKVQIKIIAPYKSGKTTIASLGWWWTGTVYKIMDKA